MACVTIGIWLRPAPSHGPLIVVAEQLVSNAFHVDQVFHIGANATQNAQHELDERALHHAAVDKMLEGVEMAHVVTFKFETRAMGDSQALEQLFNVAKGVAENRIARGQQVVLFPVEAPFLDLLGDGKESQSSSSPYCTRPFPLRRPRRQPGAGPASC